MFCCQVKDLEVLEASSDQLYWEGPRLGCCNCCDSAVRKKSYFLIFCACGAQAAHKEGSMWELSVEWDCSSLGQSPGAGLQWHSSGSPAAKRNPSPAMPGFVCSREGVLSLRSSHRAASKMTVWENNPGSQSLEFGTGCRALENSSLQALGWWSCKHQAELALFSLFTLQSIIRLQKKTDFLQSCPCTAVWCCALCSFHPIPLKWYWHVCRFVGLNIRAKPEESKCEIFSILLRLVLPGN